MACARRDGEADGEPDRSLRHMLRAIAEERSRAGLRHDTSGLGESGGAGGRAPAAPGERQPRPGTAAAPPSAAAPVVCRPRGDRPCRLPEPPAAPRARPPLHCLKCPWRKMVRRTARISPCCVFKCKVRVVCCGMETEPIFGASCQCSFLCGCQTLSRDAQPDASLLRLNDFTPLGLVSSGCCGSCRSVNFLNHGGFLKLSSLFIFISVDADFTWHVFI